MPVSQAIPSVLNTSHDVFIPEENTPRWPPNTSWRLNNYNHIYITAIMYSGPITIDGEESDFSPMSFASPLECKSFSANLAQVAYYMQ